MVYDASKSSLPYAAGRLSQQHAVDVYAKIEGQRLDWCRNNQVKHRMESLQGLMENVSCSADDAVTHAPCARAAAAAKVSSYNTDHSPNAGASSISKK